MGSQSRRFSGPSWLLAGVLCLSAPMANAISYSDDFDSGVIDPGWWTATAEGGSTLEAVNGRIEMTQGSGGFAAMGLVPPVSGDFTATVDYTLLGWPAANLERVVLNAFYSPTEQLAIERISDPQYDPTRVGEVYLTDFTGQGILGTPTTDLAGRLRLERIGDTVQGAYWNGAGWSVIGTFSQAGEGGRDRLIGFGIFSPSTVSGIKVAFDNFELNPVPLPGTLPLLLAGLAAAGLRLRKRAGRSA